MFTNLEKGLVFAGKSQFLNLGIDILVTCVLVLLEPGAEYGIRRVTSLLIVVIPIDLRSLEFLGKLLDSIRLIKDRITHSSESCINIGSRGRYAHIVDFRTSIPIILGIVDHGSTDIRFGRHTLLTLLALFRRRVLENVGGEFVTHIDIGLSSTCFAVLVDYFVSTFSREYEFGFRVIACSAEDVFDDKGIEELEESFLGMGTVNDESIVCHGGLSTKLASEELGWVCMIS